MTHIDSDPYPWPYDGDLRPANTALIVIDMQTDFCGKGGYVDTMGYDLSLTRAPIEPIARLMAAMRRGGFTVFHTREGHRPDLADLPANKRWRSQRIGAGIGDRYGWEEAPGGVRPRVAMPWTRGAARFVSSAATQGRCRERGEPSCTLAWLVG